jgi:hypothetical protein
MITLNKLDIFPKGKYKGKTVSYVIKKDPKYIIKEAENLKSFSFNENIIEAAYDELISLNDDFGEIFEF